MRKFIYKFIAVLALAITMSVPVMAQAPMQEVKTLSVKETISFYAELNNISSSHLSKVIFCESSYNPNAIGDQGLARGLAQFHKGTFDYFSKLMGEKLDYYSYNDQVKLMSWIWANYPQYRNQWSCTKIMGIV